MRMIWLGMGLMGCGPVAEVPPVEEPEGKLLISEVYYSGSPETAGAERYYSDQFIELVNAGDASLDVGGVMVGDAAGAAGEINPGMEPEGLASRKPDYVFLENVWRIPEGVTLNPGQKLVLAHDGTNHQPFSELDLSGADFEAYVEDFGGDDDYPTVPNLESVHYTAGYDWLMTVFGPSVVVVEAGAEMVPRPGTYGQRMRVGIEHVLDAVDTLMDADSGAFKRLPDAVDAGFVYVAGTYSGTSVHRVMDGDVWQDLNDSSLDFVEGPPSPRLRVVGSEEEITKPWIDLGGGQVSFVDLEDGAAVELVAGPQGGWHLDVSLKMGGFAPSGQTLSYAATTAESGEEVGFPVSVFLWPMGLLEDGDGWIRVDDRVVLDIERPDDVVGQQVTITATAVVGGVDVVDTRTWTVVDEE